MTIYNSKKIIFHLEKDEGYRVLKTLNYVNDKIKMRQYGDKVSFSEIAEHYKNDDLVIKVIKKQSASSDIMYGIRIEIANHEYVFVEFEGFIKDNKYNMLIDCIDMAIRAINKKDPTNEQEFEDCSKILSINTSTSDTVFTFNFKPIADITLTFNIMLDNCWLKFNLESLEEDDHKTFEIHAE